MNASSLPNILTASRIVLTPCIAYLVFKGGAGNVLVASLLFSLAAATDFYDGYLARRHNWPSSLGRFLDPLADKILVLTMYGLFACAQLIPWWMVLVIALRDMAITLLRMLCVYYGEPFVTSIWGKWKTAAQFFGIYLLLSVLIVQTYSSLNAVWLGSIALVFMYGVIAVTLISALFYTSTVVRVLVRIFHC